MLPCCPTRDVLDVFSLRLTVQERQIHSRHDACRRVCIYAGSSAHSSLGGVFIERRRYPRRHTLVAAEQIRVGRKRLAQLLPDFVYDRVQLADIVAAWIRHGVFPEVEFTFTSTASIIPAFLYSSI
jgi:hypothetical protein